LFDYGKGKPENPDAIVGDAIEKVFDDGVTYKGVVEGYDPKRNWWNVVYDDDDNEDLNFRQLCKLIKTPDFSKFRYSADGACACFPSHHAVPFDIFILYSSNPLQDHRHLPALRAYP
jgi:hypothetical protein